MYLTPNDDTAPLRTVTDDFPTARLPRLAPAFGNREQVKASKAVLATELERLTAEFCKLREALDSTGAALDAALRAHREVRDA